jgi:hypothetical protein
MKISAHAQRWRLVVVMVILFCISAAFWRSVSMETERTVANQIDYEDAALCSKFGLVLGSARHDACKLDLLDLRHRHEDLVLKSVTTLL